MTIITRTKRRADRVAQLDLPPGPFAQMLHGLRRREVLLRVLLCVLSAVAVWAITEGWDPPFWYRSGYIPRFDMEARVAFRCPSPGEPDRFLDFPAGAPLVEAGEALQPRTVEILRAEHEAFLAQRGPENQFRRRLYRTLALFGLLAVLYGMCGYYLVTRKRRIVEHVRSLGALLLAVVLTVGTTRWLSVDPWRAELLPPLLFAMTLSIAYGRELAMLLSACVALTVAVTVGHSLGDFILLTGVVAAAILFLRRIRTRSKLIQVGLFAGLAALALTVGVNVLDSQPPSWALAKTALWNMLWGVAAGFLISGMLPFIERAFGVLTDISLLELGDVAHPLLQELVRRAPGTYNHSINVASLAEAAAERIGASGLLVRVGAYFHDIGKMLKPGYFVENQGSESNRHESLMPAMSTLIIIAHVKDGADLARQHHLPEPLIDFIEQHHGTTLVEYFYDRATKQKQGDPDGGEVEENAYRYPGPKPQTKEAGVLMLADAVESAARVLVEPTPARIENLVHDIVKKKLDDGQFDECDLNLQELHTIEESLVKSLTAMYHSRVKYPSQRTA